MSAAARLSAAALLAAMASGCAAVGEHAPPARTAAAAPPPSHPAPTSAAPAPGQKVVRVFVPKPVKCVPDDLGPPPAYPDNDAALLQAGGAADRYQLMAAGRILRQQRLQKLEDAVKRCRNVGR